MQHVVVGGLSISCKEPILMPHLSLAQSPRLCIRHADCTASPAFTPFLSLPVPADPSPPALLPLT